MPRTACTPSYHCSRAFRDGPGLANKCIAAACGRIGSISPDSWSDSASFDASAFSRLFPLDLGCDFFAFTALRGFFCSYDASSYSLPLSLSSALRFLDIWQVQREERQVAGGKVVERVYSAST